MASITAQRNNLAKELVAKFEEILNKEGVEFFRTGANLNTITIEAGEIGGKTVYGSWKFTLHKDNYSLDDAIEDYEMLLEEREKKEKERVAKKEKQIKDQAIRDAKAAAKREADEKAKERRREALGRTTEEK